MTDNKNSLGMDEKTASWFAYILSIISAVILLATEKDNRTVRLHAWQSLFLGCAFMAAYIVLAIFAAIFFAIGVWGIYSIFMIFYSLLGLAWLVVTVICILQATQNTMFKIPVIYDFAAKMK